MADAISKDLPVIPSVPKELVREPLVLNQRPRSSEEKGSPCGAIQRSISILASIRHQEELAE